MIYNQYGIYGFNALTAAPLVGSFSFGGIFVTRHSFLHFVEEARHGGSVF